MRQHLPPSLSSLNRCRYCVCKHHTPSPPFFPFSVFPHTFPYILSVVARSKGLLRVISDTSLFFFFFLFYDGASSSILQRDSLLSFEGCDTNTSTLLSTLCYLSCTRRETTERSAWSISVSSDGLNAALKSFPTWRGLEIIECDQGPCMLSLRLSVLSVLSTVSCKSIGGVSHLSVSPVWK